MISETSDRTIPDIWRDHVLKHQHQAIVKQKRHPLYRPKNLNQTSTRPQKQTPTRLKNQTLARPPKDTLTKPQHQILTRSLNETLKRLQNQNLTRSKKQALTRPKNQTFTIPQNQTLTGPKNLTLTRPLNETLTRNHNLTMPPNHTLNIPQYQRIKLGLGYTKRKVAGAVDGLVAARKLNYQEANTKGQHQQIPVKSQVRNTSSGNGINFTQFQGLQETDKVISRLTKFGKIPKHKRQDRTEHEDNVWTSNCVLPAASKSKKSDRDFLKISQQLECSLRRPCILQKHRTSRKHCHNTNPSEPQLKTGERTENRTSEVDHPVFNRKYDEKCDSADRILNISHLQYIHRKLRSIKLGISKEKTHYLPIQFYDQPPHAW